MKLSSDGGGGGLSQGDITTIAQQAGARYILGEMFFFSTLSFHHQDTFSTGCVAVMKSEYPDLLCFGPPVFFL